MEKKRAPDEKHQNCDFLKSRKRRKLGSQNEGIKPTSSAQTLSLDSLPWQEVAFPESGFEDAEGFFGLEETSNVDVVKDPKLGKVEYKVCLELGFTES